VPLAAAPADGFSGGVTNDPARDPRPVLLFDGECGLCHRVVRLLLRIDRHGRLRFASLQSPAAQDYLRAHGLPTADFSTLVYVPDWEKRDRPDFRLRTDGVVAALRACGGVATGLGALLAVVPAPCRDAGYRQVARWRYRVFGPWRACPLPNPEWRARFFPDT
jgi:predicted DCC family thiol-disulfide oxidoreductase YuxK